MEEEEENKNKEKDEEEKEETIARHVNEESQRPWQPWMSGRSLVGVTQKARYLGRHFFFSYSVFIWNFILFNYQ